MAAATANVLELIERTRRLGLAGAAALLAQPAVAGLFERMAPPDEALDPPATKDASKLLDKFARRGLDPDCFTWFLPHFAARPVELSLIAWDALSGALLPSDGTIEMLRDYVQPPAPLAGRGLSRDGVREVARRLASSDVAAADLEAALQRGEPGAFVEASARGADFRAIALRHADDAVAFARRLARAHWYTLSSAYLGVLWELFNHRPALAALCEVLLDADSPQLLPSLDPLDDELRAELDYRRAIAGDDAAAAYAALKSIRERDGARAVAVRVDFGLRTRRRDGAAEALLGGAGDRDPEWRFGARAYALLRLSNGDGDPVDVLNRYLARFGNDAALWRGVAQAVDARPELAAPCTSVIARELFALAHEPATWLALSLIVGEPHATAIAAEIAGRLAAQRGAA